MHNKARHFAACGRSDAHWRSRACAKRSKVMNSLLRQIFVLGSGVLFFLIFISLYIAHKDESEFIALQKGAKSLGLKAANNELDKNSPFFYATSHGWGMSSVPGINNSAIEMCIINNMPVKLFREYTDVNPYESPENYLKELRSHPQRTRDFAAGFNYRVQEHFKSSGKKICF